MLQVSVLWSAHAIRPTAVQLASLMPMHASLPVTEPLQLHLKSLTFCFAQETNHTHSSCHIIHLRFKYCCQHQHAAADLRAVSLDDRAALLCCCGWFNSLYATDFSVNHGGGSGKKIIGTCRPVISPALCAAVAVTAGQADWDNASPPHASSFTYCMPCVSGYGSEYN